MMTMKGQWGGHGQRRVSQGPRASESFPGRRCRGQGGQKAGKSRKVLQRLSAASWGPAGDRGRSHKDAQASAWASGLPFHEAAQLACPPSAQTTDSSPPHGDTGRTSVGLAGWLS